MSKELLSNATFKVKEKISLPKGAKILGKTTSLYIEEIENGFIVSKSTDIKFSVTGETEYSYITKKYFSKENPLKIDLEDSMEKSLADNFE